MGPHCPINLLESDPFTPYMRVLWTELNDQGHVQGERINGYEQCPKCGLWWPNIEEPDCWEFESPNLWKAVGWWGSAVCAECDLLMVYQPDGTPECYDLTGSS